MKNSIVVIGNGPSCLNAKLGYKINEFEDVVRINNFQFEFDEYIGNKITIYACSSYKINFREDVHNKVRKVIVYDPLGIPSAYAESEKELRLPSLLLQRMLKKYGFNVYPKRPWASTGVVVLMYLMSVKRFNTVYILGFDNTFYKENNYYYDQDNITQSTDQDINVHDTPHSPELERKFIRHWINEGKLKILT